LTDEKLELSLRFDIISVATVTEYRYFIVGCYNAALDWKLDLLAGCFILSKQTER
jgi:hypothetical protein